MRTIPFAGLLAASLLSAPLATGQSYLEGFEGGSNEGDWEVWWVNHNTLESSGGNPGWYLRLDNTAGPLTCHWVEIFPGTWPVGFSGDWRAAGVTAIGIDVNVVEGAYGGEWSFVIANDNGTPDDDADDCLLELNPAGVPPMGAGWTEYEFPVPAASTSLPSGWTFSGPCAGGNPDDIWNQVIQDVSYFRFRMDSDPLVFCQFTGWNMGVDNIRVIGAIGTPYCFGDGSGTACPCGNDAAAGQGCENSSGEGATVIPLGSTSVTADDLTFDAFDLLFAQPGLLFVGQAAINGGNGIPFGDGLRCAGNTVVRLGTMTPDANGNASWGPGLGAIAGWNAGDNRYFQVWYRDPSPMAPCGSGFNLSNGVMIDFTP